MSKKLYAGTVSEDLFGARTSAPFVVARETGRSRGPAFIDVSDGGDAAVLDLSTPEFQGPGPTADGAQPRKDRPRGGPGGRRS